MNEQLFDRTEFEIPTPGTVAANSVRGATDTEEPNPGGADPGGAGGRPRLRLPVRDQVEFRWASLDQLLDRDHPARVVWQMVCRLDLVRWLGEVKAVDGRPGRDTTDPRLLVALWVFATAQGIGSAREIARSCKEHLAYQWLCGGVTINHHLLSDFRSQGGEKWDGLLTNIVAGLMAEGLVTLNRAAQDGMKTRANAGQSSFRRKPTLEECLEEARQQVETLKRLADEAPDELSACQRAARERAARERIERIEDAIRQCEELQAQRDATAKKSGRKPQPARASTTDPDARTMKMADGGYRPAVNVQFATDVEGQIVVGVDVTNEGTDNNELPPMLDQIEERYGRAPDEMLVDGGFATQEAIEDAATNHACTVYAPLKEEQKQLEKGADPYAPKKGDTPAVADWRARMGTELAKTVYRLRCQTAEWINAICRNRGLYQMPVRGLKKCRIVALLHAITHNLFQAETLRARAALAGG
jgi:transposase